MKFDDVGKITMGKRPVAPPMPKRSTWTVTTRERAVFVALNGRTIVAIDGGLERWIGRRFEELTRWLYLEGGLDLTMTGSER